MTRPRFNVRLILGLLLALALALGAGAWALQRFARAKPKPLRYETVDRGTVEIKVVETGTIESLKKVEIKSKVAGRVEKVYVEEGSAVKAGQILADIDPTEINSQVEQIRAQLQGTQARYDQALRGVIYQKAQTAAAIRQAEEALRAAESRLHVAEVQNRVQPALTASDLAQSQAGLKAAEDNLSLVRGVTHPQALVQARSACEDARAQQETARRKVARERQLLSLGYTAREQFEAAQAELSAATARWQQAKSRLDGIAEQNRLEAQNAASRIAEMQAAHSRAKANESMVSVRSEEVTSAQAAVEQARSQLAGAVSGKQQDRMREDDVAAAKAAVSQLEQQLREVEVRQRDTRLVASMDGVVSRRYIEQGELITSGVSTFSSGTPVVQIADLSRMLVRMTVNEVDVHKVRVGMPVEITIDGARGVTFHGRVSQVAPAAIGATNPGGDPQQQQQNSGGGNRGVVRFAVQVRVVRPDPRLKPGMTAKCQIIIARKSGVLRVPVGCVEGKDTRAKVEVLKQELKTGKSVETYASREVEVGLRGDGHAEIVSGLKEGEHVKPAAFAGPARKGLNMGP